MAFNWFDLIVLFGILQGIIAAFLLILRRGHLNNSRKLLAAILLVLSLLSFKIALHTLRLWDSVPVFAYFPLAIDLLIQPLLFLYVASLTLPQFKLKRKHLWHFLPVLLFMVHALIVYVAAIPAGSLAEKDAIADNWHYNAIKAFEDDLSVISTIVYGFLSFRLVARYRAWLNLNISDSRYPSFNWLNYVVISTAILGALLLFNVLADQVFHYSARHFYHWQLFYIYLSCLIYYIALSSYRQVDLVINYEGQIPTLQKSPVQKYSDQELQAAKAAVLAALDAGRIYLNSELTLNTLAAHVKLSPALVSEAINKEFGKSFRALVNDYRVAEVKARLGDPSLSHLSILGIALESGFNSEASFYRIFRAATGISPKQYIADKS